MLKKLLSTVLISLCVTCAHAETADEVEALEIEIERATEALEAAARRLSELHVGKHMNTHKGGKKAMLGVLLGPTPNIGGVEIVGTTPKGGAAQAGMVAGDLIVEIGGTDLREVDDPLAELSAYMKGVTAGDPVDVVVARNGEEQTLEIVTHPKSEHIMSLLDGDIESFIEKNLEDIEIDIEIPNGFDIDRYKSLNKFTQKIKLIKGSSDQIMFVEGDLAAYFDVEQGVVVKDAMSGSQLKNGDVFVTIGDVDVSDFDAVNDFLVDMEEEVSAQVKRKGRNRDVVIKPGEFTSGLDHEVKVTRIKD